MEPVSGQNVFAKYLIGSGGFGGSGGKKDPCKVAAGKVGRLSRAA